MTDVAQHAKQSPEALALRAKPRPITRINRKVVFVVLGALAAGVLLATLWAFRDMHTDSGDAPEAKPPANRVARAEGLESLPKDYADLPPTVPRLGAPAGELGRPLVRAESEANLAPLPESSSFRPNPEEEAIRAERLRIHAEGEAALKSALTLEPKNALRVVGASESSTAPLAQSAQPTAAQSATRVVSADGDVSGGGSKATLLPGTIIRAALVTGIQSDLPGHVLARVTEAVNDSVTGRIEVIPAGALLVGEYDSKIAYGQRRLLVAWTRIVFPDGRAIALDRLAATDRAGQAGLQDQVDWHARRLVAGALVTSLLGVGAELAVDRDANENKVLVSAGETVQDTLNDAGQEITRRNLDVNPTIRIRAGYPVAAVLSAPLAIPGVSINASPQLRISPLP